MSIRRQVDLQIEIVEHQLRLLSATYEIVEQLKDEVAGMSTVLNMDIIEEPIQHLGEMMDRIREAINVGTSAKADLEEVVGTHL